MRLLFTIPHYFQASDGTAGDGRKHASCGPDGAERARALGLAISTLHQTFGAPQCIIDVKNRTTRQANHDSTAEVSVVVCTAAEAHLLAELPLEHSLFQHVPTQCAPTLLGFECHAVLRDHLGEYDFYCFLEDDLILRDPWFFVKLQWIRQSVGEQYLIQPNRYEVGNNHFVRKAYVDGGPVAELRRPRRLVCELMGQQLVFERTTNPHSGCFFLSAGQMEQWASRPYFLDRDTSFVGPLESAASQGIRRTFGVFKPADKNAGFLEIEHYGSAFLKKIRLP